jgi:hypothetical protein
VVKSHDQTPPKEVVSLTGPVRVETKAAIASL